MIIDPRIGKDLIIEQWDRLVYSYEIERIANKFVERKHKDQSEETKELLKAGFLSIFQEPEAIEIINILTDKLKELGSDGENI